MYQFLVGPMFWLSIAICLIGIIVRSVGYVRGLHWQLDRVAYRAHPRAGIKGAARSIFFWIVPFGARGWRAQPFMATCFFAFHLGVVLVPLFLSAHQMVMRDKLGFSLFSLPGGLADGLSWATLTAAVLLALRRIALPEVRIMTTWRDYGILALSVAPFVTGLAARYHVGDYSFWLTLHILCGEALLIAVPFTRMSHIFLFFMSRAQLGMDYGIKRGGMKGHHGLAW